jgi:hypothetical protein
VSAHELEPGMLGRLNPAHLHVEYPRWTIPIKRGCVTRRRLFDGTRLLSAVQAEARSAEQRIGCPLQRANHRPDATPLHEPPLASRLPDSASTTEYVRHLYWAAHSDLITKRAELTWSDVIRDVNHTPSHALILRCASRHHKAQKSESPTSDASGGFLVILDLCAPERAIRSWPT